MMTHLGPLPQRAPSGIVVIDEAMGDEDIARLRRQWAETTLYSGATCTTTFARNLVSTNYVVIDEGPSNWHARNLLSEVHTDMDMAAPTAATWQCRYCGRAWPESLGLHKCWDGADGCGAHRLAESGV